MRYRVEGVWKHDGGEMSKMIEAPTEHEARKSASTQGILVSLIEPIPEPLDELAEAEASAPPLKRSRAAQPVPFADVLAQIPIEASRLRLAGSIIGILAWVELVGVIIWGIVACAATGNPLFILEGIAVGTILCAVLQGHAGIMRMLGLMGMVSRDIASKR